MNPEKADIKPDPEKKPQKTAPAVLRKRPESAPSTLAVQPPQEANTPPKIFPELARIDSLPDPVTRPDKDRNVVVFDLETRKLADEVGGWKNVSKMGLSVAVIHSSRDGFATFTEETVGALVAALKKADLVVGFNHMRFDYEVLKAYTRDDLRALPNLDMLVEVEKVLGHRLSLNHLAMHTLGRQKAGEGTEAVRWFREGQLDLLEKYCQEDVAITRDLYLHGLEKGFLIYNKQGRKLARIRVNWTGTTGGSRPLA